ncbi:PepSY domain-containing protein [Streptomyces sp. NPDC054833]
MGGGSGHLAVRLSHQQDSGSNDSSDDSGEGKAEATASKAAKVSVQEAIAAALKATSGTVSSAELEQGRSGPVWDVQVLASNGSKRDVTVDATNAKVLGAAADKDDDVDDATEVKAVKAFKTDARAATDAAPAAQPGTVASVEANDDTAGAWKVEIQGKDGAEHEMTVNASTGKAVAAAHQGSDHEDSDRHGEGAHED